MAAENPRHETTVRSLNIADVIDGDEVLDVRFECGTREETLGANVTCGYCLKEVQIKENGIDGMVTAQICETQCPRCGKYSGFNYFVVGNDQKAESPEALAERKEKQGYLCKALARDMRHASKETRQWIENLMKGHNLKLLFTVKRVIPEGGSDH